MSVKCEPIHNNISVWPIRGFWVKAFSLSSHKIVVLWSGSWSFFFFMYLHIRETTSWRESFFLPQIAANSGDNLLSWYWRTAGGPLEFLSPGLFCFNPSVLSTFFLTFFILFSFDFWFSETQNSRPRRACGARSSFQLIRNNN